MIRHIPLIEPDAVIAADFVFAAGVKSHEPLYVFLRQRANRSLQVGMVVENHIEIQIGHVQRAGVNSITCGAGPQKGEVKGTAVICDDQIALGKIPDSRPDHLRLVSGPVRKILGCSRFSARTEPKNTGKDQAVPLRVKAGCLNIKYGDFCAGSIQ